MAEYGGLKREGCVAVVRTEMIKEKAAFYKGNMADPAAAAVFAGQFFKNATRETVVVASLDAQNRPVAVEVVSVGLLSSCVVGMPEVFRHAILACAASIICFHNHPSSGVEPSGDDIRTTKRLQEAGRLLGIRLLDHIIVGEGGCYVSMKENGYLM